MPINNVCIQKRRLRELTVLIKKHTKFESLTPNGLNSYKQFNFIVSELSKELVDELQNAGWEIVWVNAKRDKILVSIWQGVCPEKASDGDRILIKQGYLTRDKIDKERWSWLWHSQYKEVIRLRAELESKEKSVKQLCKRVVDLKNEKEEITSGLSMFRLFFDTVELINK